MSTGHQPSKNLDAPDYTGTHRTHIHTVGADPLRQLFHLPADLAATAETEGLGVRRMLCTSPVNRLGFLNVPRTIGDFIRQPIVRTGASGETPVCPDCLAMAAVEHEVMNQKATRHAVTATRAMKLMAADANEVADHA